MKKWSGGNWQGKECQEKKFNGNNNVGSASKIDSGKSKYGWHEWKRNAGARTGPNGKVEQMALDQSSYQGNGMWVPMLGGEEWQECLFLNCFSFLSEVWSRSLAESTQAKRNGPGIYSLTAWQNHGSTPSLCSFMTRSVALRVVWP